MLGQLLGLLVLGFALPRCSIKRFKTSWGLKANYFLSECEHYTQQPEAGGSTARDSCVLHLSGKQSTFLPFQGVFACLESNRSCAHQYLRPSGACEGWGEGGQAGGVGAGGAEQGAVPALRGRLLSLTLVDFSSG